MIGWVLRTFWPVLLMRGVPWLLSAYRSWKQGLRAPRMPQTPVERWTELVVYVRARTPSCMDGRVQALNQDADQAMPLSALGRG